MTFSQRGPALFVLALLSSAPGLAAAQTPAPDPSSVEGRRAEGKARYDRGAAAYASGRFKDAIDLFLQADALAPSAPLSFNIARAYQKIGDDAATLQWFRDFRRRAPTAANGTEVDALIDGLEAALAKKGVQQVTVLSSPAGATVIIDEQPVGVTPFTGQFPPGPHKVVLSLRGYLDSVHDFSLPADQAQDLVAPLLPDAREERAATAEPAGTPGATTTSAKREPPEAASGPRFGILPWLGLGAGAAVLGGALGFELARRSAEDEAKGDRTQVGYSEKLESMQRHQLTARILAGVGGALALTGGVLLVLDLSAKSEPRSRVGLACLPPSCGLEFEGQF